ncbi:hypothetical protein [Caballeronia humi]|uniref:hypothetical protein n=1 Tax=Caballeronia humi TaxID=326474 RepID=UPI000F73EB56|nr:hypothetical protein [Caballeronia humi]
MDLANIFDVVWTMRLVGDYRGRHRAPHGCGTFPIVPLGLTMTSAKDLPERLFELLFQALAFLARALWMTVLADLCFRLEWQDCSTLTARPSATGRK